MAKYELTKEALADLEDIWKYTLDTWSEKQADTYYEILIRTFIDLTAHPEKGKPYDEVLQGLMRYTVRKHMILYYILDMNDILIIRILHRAMDPRRHVSRGPRN
jgi:toxin ParE1/3/4